MPTLHRKLATNCHLKSVISLVKIQGKYRSGIVPTGICFLTAGRCCSCHSQEFITVTSIFIRRDRGRFL